jgi:hypothetical protein
MAFWSIYSVQAFARLTELLARLDAEGLELVVVDVDDSPELDTLPEFRGRLYHGDGETAWVREGKIVTTSGLGRNTDCFEPNTLALLGDRRRCRCHGRLGKQRPTVDFEVK